ncbi:hypothetical protein GGF50DRAFT_119131 [Schizophyllum commune]
MASINSDAFSTSKNMHICPVVKHRILDLDPVQYRRQIEHFEYYWGLQRGELNLDSQHNYMELRADMSERMKREEWVLVPRPETLQAILRMAQHNKAAAPHERIHCLQKLSAQDYEYDFLPLYLLKRDRPTLFVKHGKITKTIRAPYASMPRIRSCAHPLFILFMTSSVLDLCGFLVLPEAEARAVMFPLSSVVLCWLNEPPEEFYVDADVWKSHRHPLSDDGCDVPATLSKSRKGNAASEGKVRRSTRAPCRQPKTKTAAAAKPYTRLDERRPEQRSSALPYPSVESDDDLEEGAGRDPLEVRAWVDELATTGAAPRRRTRALSSWPSTWLEAEEKDDTELASYRRESARDVDHALNPTTNVLLGSGLIIGNGVDWSGYSSNNWASRIYGVCLLGKHALTAAPE